MSTFTLEQKRLEHIRKQLYGKQPSHKSSSKRAVKSSSPQQVDLHTVNSSTVLNTEQYITRDLMKVFILSILAIALQLFIYQALINKWIHINFYGITY